MTRLRYILVVCFWVLLMIFGWMEAGTWYIFVLWFVLMTIACVWILNHFKNASKKQQADNE